MTPAVWIGAIVVLIAVWIPARSQAMEPPPSDSAAVADPPALPLPADEIESPERLEDGGPFETAWLARLTVRDRAMLLRRLAVAGRSAGVELGATVDHPAPGLITGTFVARSRGPGWTLLAAGSRPGRPDRFSWSSPDWRTARRASPWPARNFQRSRLPLEYPRRQSMGSASGSIPGPARFVPRSGDLPGGTR